MAIAGWEGGTSRKRGAEEAIDEWDLLAVRHRPTNYATDLSPPMAMRTGT